MQVARQQECAITSHNQKLRQMIQDMLCERFVFNRYYFENVKNLKDRRKFLLDMLERINQAFNQGADLLDNYKKLQSRRAMDRDFHISEMVKMERQIDANHIMNLFLGGKGKKRHMAPLEPREIRRRDNFKEDYSARLNLYNSIIDNIKTATGTPNIVKAIDYYLREENEGFQICQYLNDMDHQIEKFANSYFKLSTDVSASQEYNRRKLKYFEERIGSLTKQFDDEIAAKLKMKNDRAKFEGDLQQYFDRLLEIMELLGCDLSPLQKLLGDHKKVNVFNVRKFISILEPRATEVLAAVYCDQRKNADILAEDSNLIVTSLRRPDQEPVKLEDVITTQQCAECAEGEDVNRYDETTVYPLDHDTIRGNMRAKVETAGLTYRMHNLSKCNLPRSGIIASRRYAE